MGIKGDYMYGQANLPGFTSAWDWPSLFDRKALLQRLLGYPRKMPNGGEMGLSGYLLDKALYVALPISLPPIMRGGEYLMMVEVSAGTKSVIACVTDYGPAADTGRGIDLSPQIMAYLQIKTDDLVTWKWWF
jgi:hypothetical protein